MLVVFSNFRSADMADAFEVQFLYSHGEFFRSPFSWVQLFAFDDSKDE
jgi:hypothetical protein